jgi:hypothetical protein
VQTASPLLAAGPLLTRLIAALLALLLLQPAPPCEGRAGSSGASGMLRLVVTMELLPLPRNRRLLLQSM